MGDVVAQLQRLQELVARATAATSVEGVARVLVEEGSALLGARTGGLWLLAGDELQLVDFRSPGNAAAYARLPIGHDAPLPACVRAREPIWIEDADEYARRFPASSARTGVRVGCACLPLLAGSEVIGAAVFAFEEPRVFSEPEKVSLALFARQCAQTIERLRLAEAERTARLVAERVAARMTRLQVATARLAAGRGEDEIARIVIDETLAMIGATAAALWLRSGPEANMVAQLGASRMSVDATARMPLDDRGPLGAAMRTRRSVWVPSRGAAAAAGYPISDARWHGVSAIAFVPLVVRDELLGAIGMSFVENRGFEATERDFVEMFASHAAQALAREREASDERLVAEASQVIASSLDPETVLARVAELTVARVADYCIVDIERAGQLERLLVAHARPEDARAAAHLRTFSPPVRFGVVSAVTTQRATVMAPITDEQIDQAARTPEHAQALRELGVRSLIAAPMLIGGRAVGGVTWASRTRLFDERDAALAMRLAGGAAAAYENARLFAAERSTARRLAKHQELVAALSSARTPLEVCQAAAEKGTESLGANAAMIWLRSGDGKLKLTGAVAPPEWCAQWAVLPADPGMPANRVIASGEPMMVETPQEYEQKAPQTFAHAVLAKRVNAFIVIPLTIDGVRCGAFTISFEGAHTFTREERDSVLAIGRSCEQALERAQLYVNETTARRETEAMSRAKDTFVAMAGHALRNRISPMMGALEVMRLSRSDAHLEEREIIERQAAELVALIDELLAIASGTAQDRGVPRRKLAKGSGVEAARTSTRSLRVLVVEDNADMAYLLGNLLRTLGHEPAIAHDGPGALVCAQHVRPHLMFLDLGLPGMDGFELAQRLREQPELADVPVIALTGYDQASDRNRTREAGFVEHLVKPVDLDLLRAIVDRFS